MNPYAFAFWVPVYLIAGALAYLADRRWGIGVRGWFINLVSAAPQETREGFLVGRNRKVQYFWAFVISCLTAALMVVTGMGVLIWEAMIAIVGSVVCLIGMQLGPLVLLALKGGGMALDKMEAVEATIKEKAPQVVDQALAKGKEVADKVREAMTPDPDAPPPPTDEEVRQEKIDRMDELLGKKKRDKERA